MAPDPLARLDDRTYLGDWLHDANHYRMQLQGDAADNPDQRITDDVKLFVDRTLNIGVGLLNSIVTLASFVVILWTLSSAAPLHLFGKDIDFPGYMVWGALIYAVLGTWLTHLIGRPLVGLDYKQQQYEADFRFNLVRVRENSEQIALLDGDSAERQRLLARFGAVVDNWLGIMSRTKKVTAFTASYSQASVIFPFILVAPAYFAGKMQLGGMMQTASAFGSVQGIREAFLLPVLEFILSQFPFVIKGFHSDNGSEYVNKKVAELLNKLNIEQTKSRARQSNDNALAESKNNSVVRKHMGYSHIPQKYAKPINEFFANTFNSWLNMHRPCLFATEVVSDKGKIKKVYKNADVKTPLECLVQLGKKRLVTFKKGITLKDLESQAREKTDLQAAQEMQAAKAALFAMFNKPEVKKRA